MKYRYTRHVIRGQDIKTETVTMDADQLYREMGMVGYGAFAGLINKWNRNGLIGVAKGGPVYVYTIDEVGRF